MDPLQIDSESYLAWIGDKPPWETEQLFADLMAIMFRHDPVGIRFVNNFDEYSPEVDRIIPLLPSLTSEEALFGAVIDVFTDMFGGQLIGAREVYAAMTHDLWERWQQDNIRHPQTI